MAFKTVEPEKIENLLASLSLEEKVTFYLSWHTD